MIDVNKLIMGAMKVTFVKRPLLELVNRNLYRESQLMASGLILALVRRFTRSRIKTRR